MEAPDERLEYRSLPIADDYPRSLAAPAVIAATSVAVGWGFGAPGWGLFAAAVLLVSLARYFVPTSYALDAAGVRARFLGREDVRPWADVRALYAHRDGVHLSPFERPSRLDPFRGLFVRFAGNRERVLSFCESHVHGA